MNWQFVSFFGDSTVLLPSAVVLFAVLVLRKTSRTLAWQWAMLFGITGTVVCISKLAFMGWGIGIREIDFTGFSGHTALSTAFWPILLWLLTSRASSSLRWGTVLLGFVLAGIVGYSRLMIHAHSVSEVVSGFILGACGSLIFLLLQWRAHSSRTAQISWTGALSMVIIPLVLLNTGAKAPTQSLLGELATMIGPFEKPFTRADLHEQIY
ncbi:TPA: phosphatase PAP2 family protein [Klebsiella aerogenes]|nr:phosphatase PAP2 family protein [Klebsiella aerogenes]HCR0217237.1 phosphatase PAP2 family protein [Klebsiella aerogenes]HCR0961920.1 phosphatase PAP2 family protein [Klebsiella aerogenes]HCT6903295.1 phosphatase PAP2 family protein [Klebsiella aerogenes]HEM8233323.1 phosphatase PAP2 family protein [Klebsiella aerogenes]